jgi:hypothetical protein
MLLTTSSDGFAFHFRRTLGRALKWAPRGNAAQLEVVKVKKIEDTLRSATAPAIYRYTPAF